MGLSQNSDETREEIVEEGILPKLKLFVKLFSRWYEEENGLRL